MDHVEERLAEEVRKYDHLYNLWLTEYKDAQMACNSTVCGLPSLGVPSLSSFTVYVENTTGRR